MQTDELLAQVLRLPRGERARVAEEVWSSLETSDEEVAAIWATELERRSQDVAQERAAVVPWDTVRAEVTAELEHRRGRRSSY